MLAAFAAVSAAAVEKVVQGLAFVVLVPRLVYERRSLESCLIHCAAWVRWPQVDHYPTCFHFQEDRGGCQEISPLRKKIAMEK